MADINPWFPEPDTLTHQVLGKMAEECNELAKIAVRCMIQGLDQRDPGTFASNRDELLKEIADVEATICWAFEVLHFPVGIAARQRKKLDGFHEWQKLIEARRRPLAPATDPAGFTLTEIGKLVDLAGDHFTDEVDHVRIYYKLRALLEGEGAAPSDTPSEGGETPRLQYLVDRANAALETDHGNPRKEA